MSTTAMKSETEQPIRAGQLLELAKRAGVLDARLTCVEIALNAILDVCSRDEHDYYTVHESTLLSIRDVAGKLDE